MRKELGELKIIEKKLEAAKKDLEEWKGFSDTVGQLKIDDPDFEPSLSCQLMGISKKDDLAYCRSAKYDKCVFYRCQDRPSYQKWLEHHKQYHPNDDRLYLICNECRLLRDKEVGFMNDAISDLEIKLNQVKRKGERLSSLADVANKMNVK